jgi:hypothetical protein
MDWNVMSQMKAGRHRELAEIMANDEKFFKLYSTSHIGDIAASSQDEHNKENIESDLDYIAKVTGNYCVYNIGKEVLIEKRMPRDLYNERNELGGIFDILDTDVPDEDLDPDDLEVRTMLRPFLELLKKQQSDEVFRQVFENVETARQMRQLLPDLEYNFSQAGAFNAFLKMFRRLNEKDDYKHLRTSVQQGIKINRDRMFDTAKPYEMIEKAYKKMGIVLPENSLPNEYSPDWYNELCNAYVSLDMHGYQEDKVIVAKGRKQTFRNTNEDAFHMAFASTCDFYITSDQKSLKKSEVIYEKYKINTWAMNPDEFVAHYNQCLHFKGSKFLEIVPAIVQYGDPIVSEDGMRSIYSSPLFVFDYFNMVLVVRDELVSAKPFFLLTRSKPTNNAVLYEYELNTLIHKLLAVLGNDLDLLGGYQSSEKDQIRKDKWLGRNWDHQGLLYQLRFEDEHLRMYILFPIEEKT